MGGKNPQAVLDDADLRIDGRGVAGDVGVHRAGVAPTLSVLHFLTAIEGNLILATEAEAQSGRHESRCRDSGGLDDSVDQPFQVNGVGERRLLVCEALYFRRGVVELSGHHDPDRTGRVRVRRADHDGVGLDAAGAFDFSASLQHHRARHHQGVDSDQGDFPGAVVEHCRAGFARIVQFCENMACDRVRLPHADVRRDVLLRESGADFAAGGSHQRKRHHDESHERHQRPVKVHFAGSV